MSAIPYDSQPQEWNAPDEETFDPPRRRRRRFLNRRSAALAAAIACAAGFYAGVRVEKSQLGSTATAAAASPAAAGAGTAGAAGTGAGPRAGFAGALRGGANASVGTVASVNGKTIYLTDSSGNTVKVTLSSATKLTKSQGVSTASLRPGDTVVIQGLKSANGTIAATSVNDSGASATRTGAGTNASGSKKTSSGTTG
jgi:Domain of unknown function (DUF5666)